MSNIHSSSIDALLFDIGGVMIEIDFDRAFSHWSLYSGQDRDTIKSRFEFDSYYERHERGEIDASEYFASLRASLGINIRDEEFIKGWNSIFVNEIPGVVKLLSDIKEKLPIYAFSNTNLTHMSAWSEKFAQVPPLFRKMFVSCKMRMRKPEPEAFNAVSREIGVKPEHILFFDDSVGNISGAEKVGMQTVHVQSIEDIENKLKGFLS